MDGELDVVVLAVEGGGHVGLRRQHARGVGDTGAVEDALEPGRFQRRVETDRRGEVERQEHHVGLGDKDGLDVGAVVGGTADGDGGLVVDHVESGRLEAVAFDRFRGRRPRVVGLMMATRTDAGGLVSTCARGSREPATRQYWASGIH